MIMVTETNLFLLLAFLRKIRFGWGRYHAWTEHFLITPLYSITFSLFSCFTLKKYNGYWEKMKVILFDACLYQIFLRTKLFKTKIKLINYILIKSVMVFVYGTYRKWIFGGSKWISYKVKKRLFGVWVLWILSLIIKRGHDTMTGGIICILLTGFKYLL